jgi:flagellar biosynthesis GTPase FlhF
MDIEHFIATSAADAAQQIRARLGPDAVVVNIRSLPGRLFRKPRLEVLAHAAEPAPSPTGALLDTTDEPPGQIGQSEQHEQIPAPIQSVRSVQTDRPLGGPGQRPDVFLESLGVSPLVTECILAHMPFTQAPWLATDFKQIRAALAASWIPRKLQTSPLHVFVGAPGVGKTTTLCKWLTLSVLLEGRTARVWRLDGAATNTSEALSVHGEVLGVPVERSWTDGTIAGDIGFVDLPGVTGSNAAALSALAAQVSGFGPAQVHLVLNAAYDTAASLAQAQAFAALPVTDLIVTHLDEEPHWCKIWNLMLGTGLPVRFISAGQNIPGEFIEASAERVLARVFQRM